MTLSARGSASALPALWSLWDAPDWVRSHLGDLASGEWWTSSLTGGQRAADRALASFDVTGYARRRNEVWPVARRGASRLSPYIRHGLLSLPAVWNAVAGGPESDVVKFRDELLWQEYARHLYARLGGATGRSLRYSVVEHDDPTETGDPWGGEEACLEFARFELFHDGYLPNQMRMWLASHWSVRHRRGWREGEDRYFRHLLDGSRAANRAGWQWTVGALTGKPYGFSRWQVDTRAAGLCETCPVAEDCPITSWPPEDPPEARTFVDPRMRRDEDPQSTAGPSRAVRTGEPEAVWLTAESLGDDDPALVANPNLPAVFVFDEALLARLRLSPKRLVFLAECLADLSERREVRTFRGDPVEILAGLPVAATFAPVPGWRRRAGAIAPVEVHPWPWLVSPHAGSVTSFTAWQRSGGSVRGSSAGR